MSDLRHYARSSLENASAQRLVRIYRNAEWCVNQFSQSYADSAIFCGHAFIWRRADVAIGNADALLKHFVSVRSPESFKEFQVVVKEAVRCVTADRERVIHDSPDCAKVVNDGEAIELIHDVLGIAAVSNEVEPLPICGHGRDIQIESNAVPDNIQGDVFTADFVPVVAGLGSDVVESNEVLISEVANPFGLCDGLYKFKVGSVNAHALMLTQAMDAGLSRHPLEKTKRKP